MEPEVIVSPLEAANRLAASIQDKDKVLNGIFNKINDSTEVLLTDEVPTYRKYDVIVGVEYLLVKARFLSEFEHLNVKNLLNSDIPMNVKALLAKRDVYLAQVTLKLNAIREDISTLQKTVYTQSTRSIK